MREKTFTQTCRDEWAHHLAKFGFTHFVTLDFGLHSCRIPTEVEDAKVSITKRFLYRLGHRVARRDTEPFMFVGTFERFTKGRNPTAFHAHILVKVPPGREPLLFKHAEPIFRKLEACDSASCDIQPLDEPFGVCSYFAKQFELGETILA
jgi:hypothetical protein